MRQTPARKRSTSDQQSAVRRRVTVKEDRSLEITPAHVRRFSKMLAYESPEYRNRTKSVGRVGFRLHLQQMEDAGGPVYFALDVRHPRLVNERLDAGMALKLEDLERLAFGILEAVGEYRRRGLNHGEAAT